MQPIASPIWLLSIDVAIKNTKDVGVSTCSLIRYVNALLPKCNDPLPRWVIRVGCKDTTIFLHPKTLLTENPKRRKRKTSKNALPIPLLPFLARVYYHFSDLLGFGVTHTYICGVNQTTTIGVSHSDFLVSKKKNKKCRRIRSRGVEELDGEKCVLFS